MSERSARKKWAGYAVMWAGFLLVAAAIANAMSTAGAVAWIGAWMVVFGILVAATEGEPEVDADA